ncbi:hypothetical protein GLOIN_2v1653775 [Rhizophagus clarus]|uniref:Uncharacterized protein n=1 Tax=Rhizophagus clarus TaxID=94130 RepID=A0A8H3L1C3_9GLOM|nr:hypothetical protein GLOIN_2v1653775 [Rhizophagus clarus]
MKFQYIFLLIIAFLTYVQAEKCHIILHGDWTSEIGDNPDQCYGISCPNVHDVEAPSNCCYTFYNQYNCEGDVIGHKHCGNHHFNTPISPSSAYLEEK